MTHRLLIAQFGNELLAIPSLRHIQGEEVALHRWGNMLEAINRWLDAWITWIMGEKFLISRTIKNRRRRPGARSDGAPGRLSAAMIDVKR
jgi:hypothetical protein